MRVALAAVLFAGCASGSTPQNQGQIDAPEGTGEDAKVFLDGPIEQPIDAPVTPPIDAPVVVPVDAPPDAFVFQDACVPQTTELLTNPVFDLAPLGTGWVQQPIQNAPGGPFPVITADGLAAHSPANKVWLGGIAGEDVVPAAATVTDGVYQDVAIPAGTTQLVLTGYYVVGSNETSTTTIYDRATLDLTQLNGTPIENAMTLSNLSETLTPNGAWTLFSKTFTANVAGLSGTTVRLRATSTHDDTFVTNFFFDTLSLKSTHCP
ncbi:MAG: hypothetical protein H0T79_14590 [Deltaproteobacteria bacterium]|nr:hypothetical protein [Deltaproteobacteria bacterium]